MKKQNGITLIALIITIIVMLILVGVTVNISLNGGLFDTAKQAAKATEVESEIEQLSSSTWGSIGTDGKVDFEKLNSNLPEGFELKSGTYVSSKGNRYTIDENGTVEADKVPVELKNYVLGEDLEGKNVTEIVNMNTLKFIDDPDTEENEEETILLMFTNSISMDKDTKYLYAYIKYNSKAYKVTVDEETYNIQKLELIYETQGNEGKDLGEITGDTQYEGWTIIYDNGTTYEAVSSTTIGNVGIGSGSSSDAIDHYNSAIYDIYLELAELALTEESDIPSSKAIRNVGQRLSWNIGNLNEEEFLKLDPAKGYFTEVPSEWTTYSEYNGKLKNADMEWENDLVRMYYWGISNVDEDYWIASRDIIIGENNIAFYIYYFSSEGMLMLKPMCSVNSGALNAGSYSSNALRPIITVEK